MNILRLLCIVLCFLPKGLSSHELVDIFLLNDAYFEELADFQCNAVGRIASCTFYIVGLKPIKVLTNSSEVDASFSTWQNFDNGKCGIQVFSMNSQEDDDSGAVACRLGVFNINKEIQNHTSSFLHFKVRRRPNYTKLTSNSRFFEFMENDTMTFTCTATGDTNRYSYLVILFFGNRQMAKSENSTVSWSKTASFTDHGKMVSCSSADQRYARRVEVQHAPKIVLEGSVISDRFVKVDPSQSVEVTAYPGVYDTVTFKRDGDYVETVPSSSIVFNFVSTSGVTFFELQARNDIGDAKMTAMSIESPMFVWYVIASASLLYGCLVTMAVYAWRTSTKLDVVL